MIGKQEKKGNLKGKLPGTQALRRKAIVQSSLEQGSLCQAPVLSTPTSLPPVTAGPGFEHKALAFTVGTAEQPGRHFPELWGVNGMHQFTKAVPRSSQASTGHMGFALSGWKQSQLLKQRAAQGCELLNGSSAFDVKLDWFPHSQMSFSIELFQNRGVWFTVED